jgi:hypothetical protein
VNWINCVYYNPQRFINDTRDAIKGLAEQTEATSLMAWQNRIALDMLLAEKCEGVYEVSEQNIVISSPMTQLQTDQ